MHFPSIFRTALFLAAMLCCSPTGSTTAAARPILENPGFDEESLTVGWHPGAGTTWFDDVVLQEVKLPMSPIRITRDPLCPGAISPFQYGQFIEYLCDLVPGMWADKLYDGSFEGLTPYDVVFRKETDFNEHPWIPDGAVNRADYALDPVDPVNGKVSRRIAVDGGAPCNVGIRQEGFTVQRGVGLDFSCYLRAKELHGPVEVRLEQGGRLLGACQFQPGEKWGRFQGRMTPALTAAGVRIVIRFRGPGTLWLDMASLMPADAVGGWRRDVVDAIRALKPGIIRFGGSAVEYSNWRDTIGDLAHRKLFHAWGGLQPAAPGLEEIVQLIQEVGAEPLICVRFTGSTPEAAAAMVEYFNGSPETPMGRERAKNGHPGPYHIRYWQVGNEVSGPDYDAKLLSFCDAMKKADPEIKVMSSYPSAAAIRTAADRLDYVCPHQYGVADLPESAAQLQSVRNMIRQEAPGRSIQIGVTEWNTTGGDFGLRRATLWSLENALACSRYQNFLHRNADIVEIANRSNLVNSFCSGIIQTDPSGLYFTPTYYAQQLYATLAGKWPLKLESAGSTDIGTDISATLSADRRTVTIFAVNDNLNPITRVLDFSAVGASGRNVSVWTLGDTEHTGEPDVTNSIQNPTRIRPVRSLFHASGARFDYCFPPLSLTVLRWSADPSSR